jgi:transcriptional regulator with XRE-family HTH domain
LKNASAKKPKNIVGSVIQRFRMTQRVPVSQEDLSGRLAAKGVVISQSAIARIENGQRHVLDFEIAAIAKALRVPIEQFFQRK